MFKILNWYVAKIKWKNKGNTSNMYLLEIFASNIDKARKSIESIAKTSESLLSLISIEATWDSKVVTENAKDIYTSWPIKIN